MHANPLYDNPNRVMPKVPGLNAGQLMPSIGCDNWRTSNRSAPVPRLKHRARPMTGLVDMTKVPASFSGGRERIAVEMTRPKISARKRRAMARAAHASALAL